MPSAEAPSPPDDLILTTSTSEAYSFVFRLLCDPGDAVLVPTPSYPLFDFLAEIQDVKLVPYELVYDHGWQMDFPSLQAAIERAKAAGATCRAVLVVHPNNPTGFLCEAARGEELNRICAGDGSGDHRRRSFSRLLAGRGTPLTFSSNRDSFDLHSERAVEDFRPAADESRVDCRQRAARH